MANKDKKVSYSKCRADYSNPPEGKIYIPRVLEDDPNAKASDEHVQFAAYEKHIVMRRFSMTRLPCVLELFDDTPENREFKKQYIRMIGTFCKRRERHCGENVSPEMALPLSLDKCDPETGLPELDPRAAENIEMTVAFSETGDELKADLEASGKDRYEIYRLQRDGYKQTEIAKILNVPTSTINDRVKEIEKIAEKHRKEVLR